MIYFIINILLWIAPTLDRENSEQINPIISAIQVGSSTELAKHFNPSIYLNINGQQGDYSKTQAEIVLKDFFKKNPPVEFSLVFKNENQNSVNTYIGNYTCSQGSFKVFIKISQSDSNFLIYSLDFVKS
jgi:hypothetical protein